MTVLVVMMTAEVVHLVVASVVMIALVISMKIVPAAKTLAPQRNVVQMR
jgi:hypothetical protein